MHTDSKIYEENGHNLYLDLTILYLKKTPPNPWRGNQNSTWKRSVIKKIGSHTMFQSRIYTNIVKVKVLELHIENTLDIFQGYSSTMRNFA